MGGGEREKEVEGGIEINFATRWLLVHPRTHARVVVDFHEGVKDIYGGGC